MVKRLLDEFWDAIITWVATDNTIRFQVEAVS